MTEEQLRNECDEILFSLEEHPHEPMERLWKLNALREKEAQILKIQKKWRPDWETHYINPAPPRTPWNAVNRASLFIVAKRR